MNGDEVFLVGFQAMLEHFPAEHAPLGHDHLALDGFLQVAHVLAGSRRHYRSSWELGRFSPVTVTWTVALSV